MKTFKFLLSILTFAFCLLTLAVSEANAQTTSLSLWPPLTEVLIKPGKVAAQVYKLTNNSNSKIQIIPQIYPFQPLGEKGQIKIIYPKRSADTKDLVFFSIEGSDLLNQPLYLDPKETREIVLKIGVPRTSLQQDYYYTLLFSTSVNDETGINKTASVSQIGSNILITTSETGELILSGKITQFSVPKIIDSFSPVDFTIKLQNTGNTYFKPFGKMEITGILKQKSEIKILEQNILANTARQLSTEPFRPKLAVGPFKSKINITLNQNGPSLSGEVTFWYIPYKALIGIIIAAVILLFVKKVTKSKKYPQDRS